MDGRLSISCPVHNISVISEHGNIMKGSVQRSLARSEQKFTSSWIEAVCSLVFKFLLNTAWPFPLSNAADINFVVYFSWSFIFFQLCLFYKFILLLHTTVSSYGHVEDGQLT